jgi:hypothetical protein
VTGSFKLLTEPVSVQQRTLGNIFLCSSSSRGPNIVVHHFELGVNQIDDRLASI